jgi:hypothetical protein
MGNFLRKDLPAVTAACPARTGMVNITLLKDRKRIPYRPRQQ